MSEVSESSEKLKDVLDTADSMVTVGRFMNSAEAQLAASALEAEGIESYVQGANASSLYPGTLSTRLLVKREDQAEAEALLMGSDDGVLGPEGDDAE